MKHRELIIAAIDGKQIQWCRPGASLWVNFSSPENAISSLVHSVDAEYRIKPEPVPDKVTWGIVCSDTYTEREVREWLRITIVRGEKPRYTHIVKLTIKTDENGVESKTVELV